MAIRKIYNQETNGYYNVNFDLKQAVLDDTSGGDLDFFLAISTDIPTTSGGRFPTFRVRTLADVAPGYSTAGDFSRLCEDYIEYFTVTAQLAYSSSSSSSVSSFSSSSEGITSSSSTSSEGYTSSSSSQGRSSSSSSLDSSSSSSSEGESSSSSSEGESSSSSSEGESSSSSSEGESSSSS